MASTLLPVATTLGASPEPWLACGAAPPQEWSTVPGDGPRADGEPAGTVYIWIRRFIDEANRAALYTAVYESDR